MKSELPKVNTAIDALELARAANVAEAAAIVADAQAAAAETTGEAINDRVVALREAEIDVDMAELRAIAMLPALDEQDRQDRVAAQLPTVLFKDQYYGQPEIARAATLKQKLAADLA